MITRHTCNSRNTIFRPQPHKLCLCSEDEQKFTVHWWARVDFGAHSGYVASFNMRTIQLYRIKARKL